MRRSLVPVRLVMVFLGVVALGIVSWSGCRSTPVTGRRQLLIVPETQEIAMGASAYQELLANETLSTNPKYLEMVQRVGERLAAVADRPDYDWEFRVIASDEQNAFALPGGKVAIYEGILPICENEAGLAVVMAHEIAHALARHGGERMSQAAIANGVQKGVELATREQSEANRNMMLSAYGVASKYGVLLPYSRKQESEADHIGLMLMAKAGYNPEEAPEFWERFSAAHAGQATPEFLSTHPSDDRRAGDLRQLLPKAIEYYAAAPVRYGNGDMLVAPRAGSPSGIVPAGSRSLAP